MDSLVMVNTAACPSPPRRSVAARAWDAVAARIAREASRAAPASRCLIQAKKVGEATSF